MLIKISIVAAMMFAGLMHSPSAAASEHTCADKVLVIDFSVLRSWQQSPDASAPEDLSNVYARVAAVHCQGQKLHRKIQAGQFIGLLSRSPLAPSYRRGQTVRAQLLRESPEATSGRGYYFTPDYSDLAPKSLAAFLDLSEKKQALLLDRASAAFTVETFTATHRRWQYVRQQDEKDLATEADLFLSKNHAERIETSFALVGSYEKSLVFVRAANGDLLGTRLRYRQQGCEMPDGDASGLHFETVKEARAAGCKFHRPIFWQLEGLFDWSAAVLWSDEAFSSL